MLDLRFFDRMSRFWRLGPIVALAAAALLLIAGVTIAVFYERSYQQQKASEVGVQAQILASTVTAALVFNDRAAAQEYVAALAANPEVRAAAVYDDAGNLFAAYGRPGAQPLPPRVSIEPARYVGERLVVVAPVTQGADTLGTVYLRTITEPTLIRLARYAGIALLIVMTALFVAVLGFAQAALGRANRELEARATELAAANAQLHAQIAEREKAEEALRHSQKMEAIGQLSGGIAHDFNNLLTIIRGNLQRLQQRLAEGRTDVGGYVELAMEGLNRASSVTQRVLAFSRRQSLSPRPVNLSRLIAGMEDLLRHSTGDRIAIETRLAADWWTVCDPNQMENVLLNLAINARDAMPDGGRLIIETADVSIAEPLPLAEGAAQGDYVRLSVTDTGIGMSEEVRRRAVDPFFTTKPEGQGTGLGLSMIFGYIKQSQGFLDIRSAPGKGTAVTILMPRRAAEAGAPAPADEPMAARPPAEPAAESAGPPTVLIVEDEALVRMLTVETIEDIGCTVIEAGDGNVALQLLGSDRRIDLLISDVKLPGASGYQLAEAGLAQRPGLKILLVTGYAQDQVPDRLTRQGVKVLYKPYDVEDLAGRARDLLGGALADGAPPARASG